MKNSVMRSAEDVLENINGWRGEELTQELNMLGITVEYKEGKK